MGLKKLVCSNVATLLLFVGSFCVCVFTCTDDDDDDDDGSKLMFHHEAEVGNSLGPSIPNTSWRIGSACKLFAKHYIKNDVGRFQKEGLVFWGGQQVKGSWAKLAANLRCSSGNKASTKKLQVIAILH